MHFELRWKGESRGIGVHVGAIEGHAHIDHYALCTE